MSEYDIDYLRKLETNLTDTFNRSHLTYSELETKARFIATAFSGLLVGVTGYFILCITHCARMNMMKE